MSETLRSEGLRRSMPYMSGLDGVRALAVVAVVLYHLEVGWLPGGFLGVDVFFVVSGFLITSLLLADVRRRGRFDVRDFWMRRARRLLPALALVLVGVVLYVAVALPGELADLRGQVLAATGYVTNWSLILTDTSYFEAFSRPPLLRHLWSLAVEEQFYLLWPVAFAAGWALLRRRMLSVVWLGAIASAVAMAVLHEPLTDPSRVYFGTDTRAVGLLVGVGLAYVTSPAALVAARTTASRIRGEIAGWAGLGVLAGLMVLGSEFSTAMYRGGFLLAALATLGLIVGAAGPTSLARLMRLPGLTWIGRRSYGIYLWHWPVLMVTRPELDVGFDGPGLLMVRVGLTVGLAAASYRWLERPIIEHGFGRWLRGLPRPRPRPAQAAAVGGAATLVVASAVAVLSAPLADTGVVVVSPPVTEATHRAADPTPGARVPGGSEMIEPVVTPVSTMSLGDEQRPTTGEEEHRRIAAMADGDTPSTTAPPGMSPSTTTTTVDRGTEPASPPAGDPDPGTGDPDPEEPDEVEASPATDTSAPPTTTTAPPDPPPTVTAIGDSVMLGAAEALSSTLGERVTVDGEVSRSFADGVSLIEDLAGNDRLGDVVVVHLGTNGPIDGDLVDALAEAAGPADRLLVVTVRVPRRWEEQVNETLLAGAERRDLLEIVDWHRASDDRPGLFVDDGVHLTKRGRRVYADLVASAIDGG